MRRPSALVLGSPVTAPMVWWKSPKYGSTPMRRCRWDDLMGMLGSNQWKKYGKMWSKLLRIAIFGAGKCWCLIFFRQKLGFTEVKRDSMMKRYREISGLFLLLRLWPTEVWTRSKTTYASAKLWTGPDLVQTLWRFSKPTWLWIKAPNRSHLWW